MKYTWLLLLFCLSAFGQCPVISKQPEHQSDCDGNSIRMVCLASAGALFQWERKRPSDATYISIMGATGSSYQIFPSGDVNNPTGTLYRAKVSLGSCSVYSDPAEISLHKISSILNPGICERGSGSLEVQIPDASNASANSFQWSRSTDGLTYSDIRDDATFSGSQTKSLRISNALLALSGQKFKVRVLFSITPNNDNEGSLTNENQTSTCPRTSIEVSLQIKSSPVPVHATTLYKGCLGAPIGINSTGCSPYTTQWYDSNQQKIGVGARISVVQLNKNPVLYKATCVKLGCESLPSLGTSAQAYDIPPAPVNAGTPASICPGNTIVFKASGGTNNIWYLTESATSALSTATNLSVSSTTNSGTDPFTITRWVSQKINECESPRTAIDVKVPIMLSASAGQSTTINPSSFYDTKDFVSARGGTPPYRYQWTTSNHVTILSPTDSNPKIGPYTSPGYVRITLTDQANCVAKDSIYISLSAKVPPPVEPDNPTSPVGANSPGNPDPVSIGSADPGNGQNIGLGGVRDLGNGQGTTNGNTGNTSGETGSGGNSQPSPGQISSGENTELGISGGQSGLDPNSTIGPSPTGGMEVRQLEPVIPPRTTMIVTKTQHCDTESYHITVEGCPAVTNFYNQYGPDKLIGTGNIISFQVSYEKYVTIRCDGGNADPINLTLEGLQKPQILISKNFDAFLCAGNPLEIKTTLPPETHLIGWEKDGHLISESPILQAHVFESGQYQAVVNKLGCIHRSEIISVPVHPMAKTPTIQGERNSMCVQDSLSVSLLKPEAFFEWNENEKTSTIRRKTNKEGIEVFKARQSIDGFCWSDWSKPYEITVHPLPEKPTILPIENYQMCDGETRTLTASKAFRYHWNIGTTQDTIQVRHSGEFFLHTSNEWGCISPTSEHVRLYNRPKPATPLLFALGSYFLQAHNTLSISAYEWSWKDRILPDSNSKIKAFASGIYQVRAKKTYVLANNPTINCWSPTAQIPFEPQEFHHGFSVYPNPSTGEKINIEIWKDIRQGIISLIDFRGITLQTWEIQDSKDRIEINITGIKQGEYVLRLSSPDFQADKVIYLNP